MPQVRVNVRSLANVKAVRKEKRNGRDVVIVPSATLPDNVIMNGIKYPAEEIEGSYLTLNRTPAPLGHPVSPDGKFISARDPEGINIGWIGAHNENARREGGRVWLDKVIDVQVANQSEGGKAVLAAIEKGEAIHTSTGLLCQLDAANGAADHTHIAKNIVFDHDAILLGEEGAATPEQGVGMLVNSKGETEDIKVINSALSQADSDLDWAIESVAQALAKRERVPMLERIKSAVMEAFGSGREPSTNTKEDEMTVTKEQFDVLSAEVKALSEALKPEALATTVGNAVATALKPITDAQEAIVANQKAKDDAEHAELVTKIVNAKLLDEPTAKATPLATLRALAPQAAPKTAAALNASFKGGEKQGNGFKLPEGDK